MGAEEISMHGGPGGRLQKGRKRPKLESKFSLKEALLDKLLQAPPMSQAPNRRWREKESTNHYDSPCALKKLAIG